MIRVAVGRWMRSTVGELAGGQRAVALDRGQRGRLRGAELGAGLLAQAPRRARDGEAQASGELARRWIVTIAN